MSKNLLKLSGFAAVAAAAFLVPDLAMAKGIGEVAGNLKQGFTQLADLIVAGAYLGGAGIGVQAALQFKKHNENPQQVPLSKPITYLFVAACLLTLPSFIETGSDSIWGVGGGRGSSLDGGGQNLRIN